MANRLPTLEEFSLGVFLHDIGKFMQRAHGRSSNLPPAVRELESQILPPDGKGGYTHRHALWSEAFFHWMEEENLGLPGGMNRVQVRNSAVYHHSPGDPIGYLSAESDRLAAGMDRKKRDEDLERTGGWDAFIKTALHSPFAGIALPGNPSSPVPAQLTLGELLPGESLMPRRHVDTDQYQSKYRDLWTRFTGEFRKSCALESTGLFLEQVLSLSERFQWAIPSSTVDQPDISLHDHARAAAAIGAALYRWHERDGSLEDKDAILNRTTLKFRFLAGDLSGIQRTLFQLANQQVRGVNKILRARSFLMGMLTEGASLLCRQKLALPPFSVVQNAGGRFLLLVADVPGIEALCTELREEIEPWMFDRYYGELALNLALTPTFSGRDLARERFSNTLALVPAAVEEAKHRAFSTCLRAVDESLVFPKGPCVFCGRRPGKHAVSEDGSTGGHRCDVCQSEFLIGQDLPRACALTWHDSDVGRGRKALALFGSRLYLHLHLNQDPLTYSRFWLSGCRFHIGEPLPEWPIATRFLAAHLPELRDPSAERYRDLEKEGEESKSGDPKTFGHIGREALEDEGSDLYGEPFLAVLKADVDRLGQILTRGIPEQDRSLSRLAALSRMLDLFFSGYLPRLLRTDGDFENTYTVFAGGDDLLLIGPWRQTLLLAQTLQQKFSEWSGGNPSVTLSAAIEFMKVNHPLNRAARMAEQRLEEAKNGGRNAISVLDRKPKTWRALTEELAAADRLTRHLRSGDISQAFGYRLLEIVRTKERVESGGRVDLRDASWRAHWGYLLARQFDGKKKNDPAAQELRNFLNSLLALDTELRPSSGSSAIAAGAIQIALYRNRKFSTGGDQE